MTGEGPSPLDTPPDVPVTTAATAEASWNTLFNNPLLVETSRSLPSFVRKLINRSGKFDRIGDDPDLMQLEDLVKSLGLIEVDSDVDVDAIDSFTEMQSLLYSSIIGT